MRLCVLLFCSIFVFGQNSPSRPESKAEPSAGSSDERPTNNGFDHVVGAHRRQAGAVEILSDTRGVDFGPYVQRMLSDVKYHWFKLIPESDEMKQGKLAIEFAISKEGRVANMCLVAISGDVALDRAAWNGITSSNPFPPWPTDFTGPYLALRFRFYASVEGDKEAA